MGTATGTATATRRCRRTASRSSRRAPARSRSARRRGDRRAALRRAPVSDALPAQLAPMLCRIGKPFDAADHLFEVKWDGVRALAFVDGGTHGWRLHSRHRTDLRGRYPELEELQRLPAGTLLDGELVVLDPDGKPDFPAVLTRENARRPERSSQLARQRPVVYVAFDLLYDRFEPLLDLPLRARRQRLEATLQPFVGGRLVLSEGIV